jgi:hypothetical protein
MSSPETLAERLAKKHAVNVHMATSRRAFVAAIKEAIEECAKVADEEADSWLPSSVGGKLCRHVAAAIRRLKGEQG